MKKKANATVCTHTHKLTEKKKSIKWMNPKQQQKFLRPKQEMYRRNWAKERRESETLVEMSRDKRHTENLLVTNECFDGFIFWNNIKTLTDCIYSNNCFITINATTMVATSEPTNIWFDFISLSYFYLSIMWWWNVLKVQQRKKGKKRKRRSAA